MFVETALIRRRGHMFVERKGEIEAKVVLMCTGTLEGSNV